MWLWTACSTRRVPANMPAKSVSLQGWSLDIWIQPHCHQSVNCRCRKWRNYKKHSGMKREEWKQQPTMKHSPWGTVILKRLLQQLTTKRGTSVLSHITTVWHDLCQMKTVHMTTTADFFFMSYPGEQWSRNALRPAPYENAEQTVMGRNWTSDITFNFQPFDVTIAKKVFKAYSMQVSFLRTHPVRWLLAQSGVRRHNIGLNLKNVCRLTQYKLSVMLVISRHAVGRTAEYSSCHDSRWSLMVFHLTIYSVSSSLMRIT